MSSFDIGYCDLQEYFDGEAEKLQPAELMVDEIHLLMLSLRSRNRARQAAKKPARILGVSQEENGLYRVGFNILDVDLQPELSTEGEFDQCGYWRDASKRIVIDGTPTDTGYFRSNIESLDDELEALMEEMLVPIHRPAPQSPPLSHDLR